MQALLDRLDFLADLPYEQITVDAALNHQNQITDLNRRQLDQGLDANGKSLGRYQNYGYKGRWEPVDLLNEGPFRDSFKLDAFGTAFQTLATDEKTEKLQAKYGDAIVGTPIDDLDTVGMIVLPDVILDIERRL